MPLAEALKTVQNKNDLIWYLLYISNHLNTKSFHKDIYNKYGNDDESNVNPDDEDNDDNDDKKVIDYATIYQV